MVCQTPMHAPLPLPGHAIPLRLSAALLPLSPRQGVVPKTPVHISGGLLFDGTSGQNIVTEMIEDGATNWGEAGPKPAADDFDMTERRQAIYEWVRQVRGGVLGGAFTIERHISAAIIWYMLGDRVNRHAVQVAFDEGLLTPLTFERRINVLLLIAPHYMNEDKVKALRSDLNTLRTIRNSMAHRPFWFQPEFNDDDQVINLVPMIQRGKAPVALTTPFTTKLNELISSLIDRCAKLAAAVGKEEVGREPPSPPTDPNPRKHDD